MLKRYQFYGQNREEDFFMKKGTSKMANNMGIAKTSCFDSSEQGIFFVLRFSQRRQRGRHD